MLRLLIQSPRLSEPSNVSQQSNVLGSWIKWDTSSYCLSTALAAKPKPLLRTNAAALSMSSSYEMARATPPTSLISSTFPLLSTYTSVMCRGMSVNSNVLPDQPQSLLVDVP